MSYKKKRAEGVKLMVFQKYDNIICLIDSSLQNSFEGVYATTN
jgi:hypothetical protein